MNLFFVCNGMSPEKAVVNVMRDRIGMDRAAWNQVNSLKNEV